jgi:DNA-binding winged helix-turn-helix (wHTH) protein
MDAPTPTDSFLFGQFELCPLRGLLRRDSAGDRVPVSLGSRALAVLRVLVERHGELVSKDEIMTAVWPRTTVEEANLTMQISTLRRILDAGLEGRAASRLCPGGGITLLAS